MALATDYDGTLAHHGAVGSAALAALDRARAAGRRLVLVTGRHLEDLLEAFPGIEVFDKVVAENGALLYTPSTREERVLAEAPPPALVERLRERGVDPLAVGRSIVATWEPHETTTLEVIRELGLEHQVIFNKGAVMVLPPGVNKATGLSTALRDLRLSPHNTVGVGDAENDHAFVAICECGVAVANALPALKDKADWVTEGRDGEGVAELVDALVADDLAAVGSRLSRHDVLVGGIDGDDDGHGDGDGARGELKVPAQGGTVLVAGPSSSGKSTLVTGLLERMHEAGYQFCLVDPEGDYEGFECGIGLGDADRAPAVEEVVQLLADPDASAVVSLLGLRLEDRPGFFDALLPRLAELRTMTGRPHWIVVDEAHHLLPTNRDPLSTPLPQEFGGLLLVTVHPGRVAPAALSALDLVLAVGESPGGTLREVADVLGWTGLPGELPGVGGGQAVAWRKGEEPVVVTAAPTRSERRRHRRKYAEGDIGDERSFVFRGPEGRLKLRARNLVQFLELAEGVDDDTWLHHLHQGDYSAWFGTCLKDADLAEEAAAVEGADGASAEESRARVRQAVEARYTLPA
jgi:HAD superfamily hydrolase (TIGR01484 family)